MGGRKGTWEWGKGWGAHDGVRTVVPALFWFWHMKKKLVRGIRQRKTVFFFFLGRFIWAIDSFSFSLSIKEQGVSALFSDPYSMRSCPACHGSSLWDLCLLL